MATRTGTFHLGRSPMKPDRLDGLLDRLCDGDSQAAERVFVAYEPYLRMVVRRQLPSRLRAKFDSSDVVQSVWADVLQGFRETRWRFQDVAHLRAFLLKATRNRFIDQCRVHRSAIEREQVAGRLQARNLEVSASLQPNQCAEADELWERMLVHCPSAHHQKLLQLKRQGCSLAEIAAQTGLHPSSVRRILYELARHLAAKALDDAAVV